MEKKYLIISLLILVMLAVAFGFSRYYFKIMPQVSTAEATGHFEEYSTSLVDLYKELEEKHDSESLLSKEEWKEFSASWIAKLSESRPEELSKRLPEALKGETYRFSKVYEDLLRLWQEYNDEALEGKTRIEKQTDLKNQIEEFLELK